MQSFLENLNLQMQQQNKLLPWGLVIGLSGLIPVIFGETITRASFKFA